MRKLRNLNETKAAMMAVCVNRAGYRRGAQLVEYIEDWRRCIERHGGPVGFEEYCEWTRTYSRRTAYRRLALFREVFPQLGEKGTPEGLMGPLLKRLELEDQVDELP